MKQRSLQRQLTLWFSAALLLMAGLAFVLVFSVSHSVLQKLLRDELVHTVEDNLDEVEFSRTLQQLDIDGDADQYIRYGVGYLEIDDDFLDSVNGVYTALLRESGELLYGENPISGFEPKELVDGALRVIRVRGEKYYVFDRRLESPGVRDLWLRGTVAESRGDAPLQAIARICLWFLGAVALIAVGGGTIIARRALRPIRDMSSAAEHIGSGNDLKRRMPVSPAGDELTRLAEAFNAMMQRLELSFEAEKQFVSDASHELRTPAAVILAQCDEALSAAHSNDEYRDALTVIRRQGRRMSRIISDMLTLTRMERGTDLFEAAPLDLSAMTDELCRDMSLIADKGIALTCQIEPDIMVEGDRVQLSRMLANLISNAYRYGRENGHIRVTLGQNQGQAVLAVADDGAGIAPEKQERIFDRFFRCAPDRSDGGTGLGLPIARQIACAHGGDLTVQSEVGAGSTFTVRLPVQKKNIEK